MQFEQHTLIIFAHRHSEAFRPFGRLCFSWHVGISPNGSDASSSRDLAVSYKPYFLKILT
jgi:hypothetical protein